MPEPNSARESLQVFQKLQEKQKQPSIEALETNIAGKETNRSSGNQSDSRGPKVGYGVTSQKRDITPKQNLQ